MVNFEIRRETEKDCSKVEEMTREAFWNLFVPGCDEHYLLHKIRHCEAFVPELDFVAVLDGEIIGNIVYTKASIIDDSGKRHEVLSFGPVSVKPELQKLGIGSALIKHTLNLAAEMGYTSVFIYGDPKYYRRFGFMCSRKYRIKTSDGKYAAALLAVELQPDALNGISGRFFEDSVYDIDKSELEKYDAAFPYKEKLITDTQKRFQFLCGLRF